MVRENACIVFWKLWCSIVLNELEQSPKLRRQHKFGSENLDIGVNKSRNIVGTFEELVDNWLAKVPILSVTMLSNIDRARKISLKIASNNEIFGN